MSRSGVVALGATVLFALPSATAAQVGPTLLDAGDLQSMLGRPATVVLHVGSREGFDARHVPGARFIELSDVSYSRGEYAEPGSVILDLPFDLAGVRAAFEERGVSDDSRIVVMWDEPRRFTQATRVVWTLSALGLGERTSLLDGGLPAWVAAGGAVTDEVTAPARGRITASPDRTRVVGLGWLAREYRAEELAVVDARVPASFLGDRPEFPGRAGHVPGAGNLPIERLLDEDGWFVGTDEVRSLLRDAGVDEGDRVVTYCHIGQRASAAWFAAQLAGFDAAVYDGSMNEWGRTELPLERGPRGR